MGLFIPVAQRIRAADYESACRRFESYQEYLTTPSLVGKRLVEAQETRVQFLGSRRKGRERMCALVIVIRDPGTGRYGTPDMHL